MADDQLMYLGNGRERLGGDLHIATLHVGIHRFAAFQQGVST